MGRDVGVIGLGAWQLGADWGEVTEADAHATLQAAVDAGVTFIDTADVYGDGRSEQIIGSFIKGRPELTVATKMGRRVPQEAGNYTLDNFRRVDRPVPGQPRRRHARPGPAALPADPGVLRRRRSTTRSTRWSRKSGSARTG